MNNPEVARVAEMLRNTYNGSSWHGASMMEILNNVDVAQAFQSTSHIHRICELVQHITSWRIFAIKKLDGDQNYDVSQEENWKDSTNQNESAWKEILAELEASQEKLLEKLEAFSDQNLDEEVPGKAYSFYKLIHGVIQHDLYHLGEIALLSRELSE
jgi:hypothetical protein